MEQKKKQWLPYWEKYKYFLLVIAIGMALMMFTLPDHSKQNTTAEENNKSDFDLAAFQQDLCRSLSAIEGVGRVEVMLSLESGEESIYASNVTQSSQNANGDTTSENYQSSMSILSDGSYGEQPVLIKNNFPTFRGAVIICDGADNSVVQLKITEAVSSLCGISSDRISISKMSQ